MGTVPIWFRKSSPLGWRGAGRFASQIFTMNPTANINPHIVDTLYTEALILAEDVRDAFDLSGRIDRACEDEDLIRIAMSCEALRTTTRIMHILAWLLNQRAFFKGELTELQLRRHGRLPAKTNRAAPDQVAMIDQPIRDLIHTTERLYDRIERLDHAWQDQFTLHPSAVHRLRERLGARMGMG
jgi:regulator of CtrA degradation